MADLTPLVESIKKHAPIVASLLDNTTPLAEYAASLQNVEATPEQLKRQKPIKEAFQASMKDMFSEEFVQNFRYDWDKPMAANIMDHHGIFNHTLFPSIGIILNLLQLGSATHDYPIFSSANIPANNFFYKKGFELHGKRAYLFSNKERHMSQYVLPTRDLNFVERTKNANAWKNFSPSEQAFLEKMQGVINGLGLNDLPDYHTQIARLNNELWKMQFSEEIRDGIPTMAMVSQEELMRRLIKDILTDDNHIVARAIFDDTFRSEIMKNFDGIIGCWYKEQRKGSHFFFLVDEKNEMKDLELADSVFTPVSERLKDQAFPCEKDVIIQMIEEKKLLPNLFTIFGALTFWPGIAPSVGYGSMTYLTEMRDAWAKSLRAVGDDDEAVQIESVDTKRFACVGLQYAKKSDGTIAQQHAFDVIYDGGHKKDYLEKLGELTIEKLLLPVISQFEQYYVEEDDRVGGDVDIQELLQEVFGWVPESDFGE